MAQFVNLILGASASYLAAGLIFAAVFVLRGAGQIDPAAKEGSRGFRILIIPGVCLLWPVLLKRWLSGVSNPPEESNPHRKLTKKGVKS